MTLDRRRFLTISAASITGLDARPRATRTPKSAQPCCELAERANERVEEGLFRHTAMSRARTRVRPSPGDDFPKYFISETVPTLGSGGQRRHGASRCRARCVGRCRSRSMI